MRSTLIRSIKVAVLVLASSAPGQAGATPFATTATDIGSAVLSTKGAAFLASLGLSFGL